MRKEDFFEILGELDDKIVEEAREPVKRKINWRILGTAAACFTLVCIAIGRSPLTDRIGNRAGETPVADQTAEMEVPVEEAFEAEMTAGEVPGEETPSESAPTGDIAPMAYVNDTLYIQSPAQEGYAEKREEFSYLGRIESAVSQDREPDQNFQANDPIIGCEVYQYGDDIVIGISGRYWLYVKYGTQERSETN